MNNKKTLDSIVSHVENNTEFIFIKNICETYSVNYNIKLLNQVFDKYLFARKNGYNNHSAKYIVLKDFYEQILRQFKNYQKNGKLRF